MALEKAVKISALEFDWIFNKSEGQEFLKKLAETDDMQIFDTKVVNIILSFFWSIFAKRIFIWIFIPNFILFVLFILDTTLFFP
jgi:hypothetical protein